MEIKELCEDLKLRYDTTENLTLKTMCVAALVFSYHPFAVNTLKEILENPSTNRIVLTQLLTLVPHMGHHARTLTQPILQLADPDVSEDRTLIKLALRALIFIRPTLEHQEQIPVTGVALKVISRIDLSGLHELARHLIRGYPPPRIDEIS